MGTVGTGIERVASNKWAHKDDRNDGEESALKRPHPLTVDVELPEPANEVAQTKPGGEGGKNNSSKNKK